MLFRRAPQTSPDRSPAGPAVHRPRSQRLPLPEIAAPRGHPGAALTASPPARPKLAAFLRHEDRRANRHKIQARRPPSRPGSQERPVRGATRLLRRHGRGRTAGRPRAAILTRRDRPRPPRPLLPRSARRRPCRPCPGLGPIPRRCRRGRARSPGAGHQFEAMASSGRDLAAGMFRNALLAPAPNPRHIQLRPTSFRHPHSLPAIPRCTPASAAMRTRRSARKPAHNWSARAWLPQRGAPAASRDNRRSDAPRWSRAAGAGASYVTLCLACSLARCGCHGAYALQLTGSRLTPRWKFDRR